MKQYPRYRIRLWVCAVFLTHGLMLPPSLVWAEQPGRPSSEAYPPPQPAAAPAYTQPPASSAAQAHPAPEEMVVDGLIGRPVGLAATVVGTALFIVTLPFSLLGGNADEAAHTLIEEPAEYTFNRCLGCLDTHYGSGRY